MRLIFFFYIFLVLVSCSRKSDTSILTSKDVNTKTAINTKIKIVEDSLAYHYKLMVNNRVDSLPSEMILRAIALYESYYHQFPKDSLTPIYLDKIHQLHTQEKRYTYAVNWVDTLLQQYPNYTNKAELLYSAATTSDLYLLDTNRIKRYYTRLLDDCPKLKKNIRLEIENRLRNLKYPYLEYLKISSTAH